MDNISSSIYKIERISFNIIRFSFPRPVHCVQHHSIKCINVIMNVSPSEINTHHINNNYYQKK